MLGASLAVLSFFVFIGCIAMAQKAFLKATVYYFGEKAGILEESPEGYTFTYFGCYLKGFHHRALDPELPLGWAPIRSATLFAVFASQLPEGFARRRLAQKFGVSIYDEMELLLLYCWPLSSAVCLWPRRSSTMTPQEKGPEMAAWEWGGSLTLEPLRPPRAAPSPGGVASGRHSVVAPAAGKHSGCGCSASAGEVSRGGGTALEEEHGDYCLCCYGLLRTPADRARGYHAGCYKRLFDTDLPVVLDPAVLTEGIRVDPAEEDLEDNASIEWHQPVVRLRGVESGGVYRLEECYDSFWEFELKLPCDRYPYLVELEAACMRMAEVGGLPCVAGGRIELPDGRRGYIWRRELFNDRGAMLNRLVVGNLGGDSWISRYSGGAVKSARRVRRYAYAQEWSQTQFWKMLLIAYLTGCGEVHHQDFRLVESSTFGYNLDRARNLVPTALLFPDSRVDMALRISRRVRRIDTRSFVMSMTRWCGFNNRQVQKIIDKIQRCWLGAWRVLAAAPLPREMKLDWHHLMSVVRGDMWPLYWEHETRVDRELREVYVHPEVKRVKRFVLKKKPRNRSFWHLKYKRPPNYEEDSYYSDMEYFLSLVRRWGASDDVVVRVRGAPAMAV